MWATGFGAFGVVGGCCIAAFVVGVVVGCSCDDCPGESPVDGERRAATGKGQLLIPGWS